MQNEDMSVFFHNLGIRKCLIVTQIDKATENIDTYNYTKIDTFTSWGNLLSKVKNCNQKLHYKILSDRKDTGKIEIQGAIAPFCH